AIAIAAALAAILFIAALAIGPVTIAVPDVLASVWAQITGRGEIARQDPALGSAYNVVATIRLPRAIIAARVGGAPAVAGTVLQAVFRNPLADPGIIGVSAGAATAAVLAIVTGFSAVAAWALPASAFLGALGAVAIVQLAAAMRGGGPATLVLVGIALSAFLGAVTAAAIANAPSDSDIRGVAFWFNCDLAARTWEHVAIASLPIVLGIVLLLFFSRDLNILLMGDQAARTTGVNVRRVRVVTLTVAALITASAVAVSGVIGFVGLVVPHLIRLIIARITRPCCPPLRWQVRPFCLQQTRSPACCSPPSRCRPERSWPSSVRRSSSGCCCVADARRGGRHDRRSCHCSRHPRRRRLLGRARPGHRDHRPQRCREVDAAARGLAGCWNLRPAARSADGGCSPGHDDELRLLRRRGRPIWTPPPRVPLPTVHGFRPPDRG